MSFLEASCSNLAACLPGTSWHSALRRRQGKMQLATARCVECATLRSQRLSEYSAQMALCREVLPRAAETARMLGIDVPRTQNPTRLFTP